MKPKAKRSWHKEAVQFFRKTIGLYEFSDDLLRVLYGTSEQLSLFYRCLDQLEVEGRTFLTETGQIKKHPLLESQKHAWSSFIQGVKVLGLHLDDDDKRPPGRPPGR